MLIVLGYAALTFYSSGLAFWTPDYLHEHFGMKMSRIAIVLGGVAIFAGIVGMFSGATIMDKIFRKVSNLYGIEDINT